MWAPGSSPHQTLKWNFPVFRIVRNLFQLFVTTKSMVLCDNSPSSPSRAVFLLFLLKQIRSQSRTVMNTKCILWIVTSDADKKYIVIHLSLMKKAWTTFGKRNLIHPLYSFFFLKKKIFYFFYLREWVKEREIERKEERKEGRKM